MDHTTTKPAATSLTIWAVMLTLLGSALPVIAVELANWPPTTRIRLISLSVSVVGAIVATYGRVFASVPISGTFTGRRDG